MEPRFVAIVAIQLVGALALAAMAVRAAALEDRVFAVVQGVVVTLVLALGFGIVRSV